MMNIIIPIQSKVTSVVFCVCESCWLTLVFLWLFSDAVPVDRLVGIELNPGPTTRTCGTCGDRRKMNISTCKYCKCYTCSNCWSGGPRICNSCVAPRLVGVTRRDQSIKPTLFDIMIGEGPYSFGHSFAMILYIPCVIVYTIGRGLLQMAGIIEFDIPAGNTHIQCFFLYWCVS